MPRPSATPAPRTMKLSREKAYEKKGETYYKWRVNLPAPAIEAMGWQHEDELDVEIDQRNDRLILRKTKK